jgi:two-component system nitrate/nitrite response regulator NarL
MQERIPTILVDQTTLFREGLERILAGSQFKLVKKGVATTGDLASAPPITDVRRLLFLVGTNSYVDTTVRSITWIKENYPEARIVVLADAYDLNLLTPILRAGAHSFLLETMTAEALLKSLDLVMHGDSVISSAVLPLIYRAETTSAPPSDPGVREDLLLSEREKQILDGLARGESNKAIARELQITESTVKVHVKAVLRKLKVNNRTQAAIWAAHHLARSLSQLPLVYRHLSHITPFPIKVS